MQEITHIFDSHAHYDDNRFDADRDRVLGSLAQQGVERLCNVSASLSGCASSYRLAEKYDFIYASAGVHPEYADQLPANWLNQVAMYAKKPKIVAIGEIGLDYHYPDFSKTSQKKIFAEQMELARQMKLPVIIHSRDAMADTLDILRQFPDVRGVVHCFSGSAETARELVKQGWYIGFTGVVTFKNAKKTVEAAKAVPLSHMLIETDCPYMAPEPFRGRRCDSSMLTSVIRRLCEIKEVSPQQIANITFDNACKMYRIGA